LNVNLEQEAFATS